MTQGPPSQITASAQTSGARGQGPQVNKDFRWDASRLRGDFRSWGAGDKPSLARRSFAVQASSFILVKFTMFIHSCGPVWAEVSALNSRVCLLPFLCLLLPLPGLENRSHSGICSCISTGLPRSLHLHLFPSSLSRSLGPL